MNRKRRHHGGFTIVELLVASTVGLLLVIGVIEAFRQIANAVNKGRATVQLSGQLRNVTNLLRKDFQGITVPAIPNISTDSGAGYFEIIEGEDNDLIQSATDTLSGDTDDVIMFTSRRLGEPFSGRVFVGMDVNGIRSYETITSPNAEIIYWLEPRNVDGSPTLKHNDMPLATLRRRALLIRPDRNNSSGFIFNVGRNKATPLVQILEWLNENDISVRLDPSNGNVIANTLSDLSLRQNRVAHIPSAGKSSYGNTFRDVNFPYRFDPARLPCQWGNFLGEDVVLDQVISFDIRVYDPSAKVLHYIEPPPPKPPETPERKQERFQEQEPLVPGDEGYATRASTATEIGRGGYIDLGFQRLNPTPDSLLSGKADKRAKLNHKTPSLEANAFGYFKFGNCSVYDTWTIEYERDGINQNYPRDITDPQPGENMLIDEGFDGIDNNFDVNAGVDDATEREAPPPYPQPLRGFQVIVRAFQNGQQQTRQFTINHDFTPE
jgi:type II secretory pathway pseudopilin PulG